MPIEGELLAITEKGRAELKRLLKASLRGPVGEVNKLIIALKLQFLGVLELEDRLLQVEMLAETFEQELARLNDLRAHLADRRACSSTGSTTTSPRSATASPGSTPC